MRIRTALKAGVGTDSKIVLNHSETLAVRSALKAGGEKLNHNETLVVRTALKAAGASLNHNQPLKVRTQLKAGLPDIKLSANHNETLRHTQG